LLLLAGVSNFSSVHGLTLLTGLLKLNGHVRNHCRRTWATVHGAEGGVQLNSLVDQHFLGSFSLKVLEKVPLCEKITHRKSYLIILNGNRDIRKLRFLAFLTVRTHLTLSIDTNLRVDR
jgi:hypothetical protein